MSPSTRPAPADTPARAFVRVGFPTLLAKLYRYATGTLHLARIDADSADVVEAVDLVNALVETGLRGRLTWDLTEEATDEQIVAYACKKLYGMRSNLRKKAARMVGDDDARDALDELPDEAPDALERFAEHRGIADVVRALAHDPEASAHLTRMLEGKDRAEIVYELGCTPERADVVRKRISRGIARMNDESEAGPPSSGPRGTYHEPQATEERQGAAREPLRGARGAWRRR